MLLVCCLLLLAPRSSPLASQLDCPPHGTCGAELRCAAATRLAVACSETSAWQPPLSNSGCADHRGTLGLPSTGEPGDAAGMSAVDAVVTGQTGGGRQVLCVQECDIGGGLGDQGLKTSYPLMCNGNRCNTGSAVVVCVCVWIQKQSKPGTQCRGRISSHSEQVLSSVGRWHGVSMTRN